MIGLPLTDRMTVVDIRNTTTKMNDEKKYLKKYPTKDLKKVMIDLEEPTVPKTMHIVDVETIEEE